LLTTEPYSDGDRDSALFCANRNISLALIVKTQHKYMDFT
jgi:hypothetical protein